MFCAGKAVVVLAGAVDKVLQSVKPMFQYDRTEHLFRADQLEMVSPAPCEPVSPRPLIVHERSWTDEVSSRLVVPYAWEGEAEEATVEVESGRLDRDSDTPRDPATEEVNIEEESSNETALPRIAPDPGQPSSKQMVEHRITHSSYRIWCKFCVMGRGRGTPHGRSDNHSRMAVVGVISSSHAAG